MARHSVLLDPPKGAIRFVDRASLDFDRTDGGELRRIPVCVHKSRIRTADLRGRTMARTGQVPRRSDIKPTSSVVPMSCLESGLPGTVRAR